MKIPSKWDREADVVVLGFGGAGTVAAVTALDQGACVLVLEKQSFGGGDANTLAGLIDAADKVMSRLKRHPSTRRAAGETLLGGRRLTPVVAHLDSSSDDICLPVRPSRATIACILHRERSRSTCPTLR